MLYVLHLQTAVRVPTKPLRTTFVAVQPKVSVLTVKPPRLHARVLMPTKDLFAKVRFRYIVQCSSYLEHSFFLMFKVPVDLLQNLHD